MTTHERLDAPFRISPGITLRARPGYIVYMNGEWNDVLLPEGRFSSNLYRAVGETQFTPFVALDNNVQFDTVSRVMGWQSRSDGFSGLATTSMSSIPTTGGEDPLVDRFASLDSRASSKLLYTHRF
jgi:hypothetical protein